MRFPQLPLRLAGSDRGGASKLKQKHVSICTSTADVHTPSTSFQVLAARCSAGACAPARSRTMALCVRWQCATSFHRPRRARPDMVDHSRHSGAGGRSGATAWRHRPPFQIRSHGLPWNSTIVFVQSRNSAGEIDAPCPKAS
jgi:hypothetical protein